MKLSCQSGTLSLLLLLLLLQEDSQKSLTEAHTLRYDLMALSQEGSGRPQFLALGYLNDELFLRYDGDSRRAQPRGHMMKGHVRAETWARETEDLQEKEQQLRRLLEEVMGHHRHHRGAADQDSKMTGPWLGWSGLHSLQATFGCQSERNLSTGGFWHIGQDGQDFLTFNPENFMWEAAKTSDQRSKMFWEMNGPTLEQVKTFLYDICPAQLQRHLASIRHYRMDAGPPRVNLTSGNYPVGRITLTCRAFNLYPRTTTLIWLRDGDSVHRHISGPEVLLPSGDGTYQTSVSRWILPGEEPWFSCQVRQGRESVSMPVFLRHQAKQTGGARSAASALAVSALPAAWMLLACV